MVFLGQVLRFQKKEQLSAQSLMRCYEKVENNGERNTGDGSRACEVSEESAPEDSRLHLQLEEELGNAYLFGCK